MDSLTSDNMHDPGSHIDPDADNADLKWAVAHTLSCASKMSCLKHRTCLGRPICTAQGSMGSTAGFVVPTQSSEECGYCVPAFRGYVCFCPTRWALHRADTTPL